MGNEKQRRFESRNLYLLLLLAVTGMLILIALVLPFYSALSEPPLKQGDVASTEVRAPAAKAYESEILTNQQQERAVSAVEPIYSSPDTTLPRRQLERLRAALSFINTVRLDSLATTDQKLSDLASLEDLQLKKETSQRILEMSPQRWEAVQREAIVVLEQVMRAQIREDRLDEARQSVPAAVSLHLPDDQAYIVAEVVSPFVIPNSLFEKDQTEAARLQAAQEVPPQVRSYAAGETIVPRGKVISALDIEALTEFGLLERRYQWQDFASAATATLGALALMVYYLKRSRWLERGLRRSFILALLFVLFLYASRLVIPGHTVVPYIFPLAAYALVVASLFGSEIALISALPMALLATHGLPFSLELAVYYTVSSFVGVLALGKARRITNFFWAGFGVALSGSAVVLAYRLPESTTDWNGLITLAASAAMSGVAAAGVALVLQFFLAQLLGSTTALQLVELSRPDHPLMQILLRNAPGTYQHSLQVANLAEQAAEKIGADALLTRVGALYHDIGKADEAIFYIENQVPGTPNPHDQMEPSTSAAVIISHVTKGLELARRYRLPARLQDFIREHHGSTITRYQYSKAREAVKGEDTQVDVDAFRYPGPRPQSRETALLMLADTSEARIRAERPKDEISLRSIIQDVVEASVASGALADTDLTLNDLVAIVDSFTATLKGVYHPRIQYPKLEAEPSQRGDIAREIPLSLPEPAENPNHPRPDLPPT